MFSPLFLETFPLQKNPVTHKITKPQTFAALLLVCSLTVLLKSTRLSSPLVLFLFFECQEIILLVAHQVGAARAL